MTLCSHYLALHLIDNHYFRQGKPSKISQGDRWTEGPLEDQVARHFRQRWKGKEIDEVQFDARWIIEFTRYLRTGVDNTAYGFDGGLSDMCDKALS